MAMRVECPEPTSMIRLGLIVRMRQYQNCASAPSKALFPKGQDVKLARVLFKVGKKLQLAFQLPTDTRQVSGGRKLVVQMCRVEKRFIIVVQDRECARE